MKKKKNLFSNQNIKAVIVAAIVIITIFALDIILTDTPNNQNSHVTGEKNFSKKSFYNAVTERNENKISDYQNTKEPKEQNLNEHKKVTNHTLKHSAWIPYWGFTDGYNSLKENPDKFDTIMPVLYDINSKGQINKHSPSKLPLLKTLCKTNNIKILPSIASFNSKNMGLVMESEDTIEKHVESIIQEVEKGDYDGIDLDYESIEIEDKNSYLNLIKILGNELKARGKVLSVTVLAQWEAGKPYSYSPETRESQNLSYIAKYADQIRIMTYDYTAAGSRKPGPIAPLPWIEQTLDYAINVEKVPADKIWVGIHLYGYKWNTTADPNNPYDLKTSKAIPLVYSQIPEIIKKLKDDETNIYDEDLGEGILEYDTGENSWSTIYYQTKQGIEDRANLAKKYGIAGTAYWRLGKEDELL